jgi:type I restriction enzyme S subunit
MLNRLGDYIVLNQEKNRDLEYGVSNVKGISIKKIFIETKANLRNVSLRPYLVVKPKYFAYVSVTSRNGEKVSIAFNETKNTYLVSSSYISFSIKDINILLPEYLYIYFNRPEFDRIARFNSWGSARETFSWEDLCDLNIEIPSIKIQKKYVDVYNALTENQKAYENGLDDLKLVCDSYIENLKNSLPIQSIKKHIENSIEKNTDQIYSEAIGIGTEGFIPPKVESSKNTKNYNLVRYNYFIYNPSRINIGSIGLYKDTQIRICSPIYSVFRCLSKDLIPDYLFLWFKREDFKRYTSFKAVGSVRDNFPFILMQEVEIPIPSFKVQKSIVNIYKVYETRKEINEKLKQQIIEICPVLIKGAIQESKGVI